MRACFAICAVALVACGSSDEPAPANGDLAPPEHGFQIRSPDIEVAAGTERTTCFYFTVPVKQRAAVSRWESKMSPGSHHVTMYFTLDQYQADDTVIDECHAFDNLGRMPIWTYSSQSLEQTQELPAGVGMVVEPQQHGFVQLHYVNATESPIVGHATINGHTFADGEEYIPAAAFVTYSTRIDIPGGVGMKGSTEGTCEVPAGAHFFSMSTHSHRRSVATWVRDGGSMLVASSDWEHPAVTRWAAPDFYAFGSGLTYHCDYVNDLEQPVHDGSSAVKDEMCMAVGYFFPASRPVLCIDDLIWSL